MQCPESRGDLRSLHVFVVHAVETSVHSVVTLRGVSVVVEGTEVPDFFPGRALQQPVNGHPWHKHRI